MIKANRQSVEKSSQTQSKTILKVTKKSDLGTPNNQSNTESKKELLSKPKKKKEAPAKSTSEYNNESSIFFQAIGVIRGQVSFLTDKEATITINGKQYQLLPNHRRKNQFKGFKNHVNATGDKTQRLVVYPDISHCPQEKQSRICRFYFFNFDLGSRKGNAGLLEDMEFILRGLWQFVPVCSIPCISIFKNLTPQNIKTIEGATPNQRINFLKAHHLPVFWENPTVSPFHFQPELNALDQNFPQFVQVKAEFLLLEDAFRVKEQIAPPQRESPRFFDEIQEEEANNPKTIIEKVKTSKEKAETIRLEQAKEHHHFSSIEIDNTEEGLSAIALGKRLGVSNSTIGQQSKKGKDEFAAWTKRKDPDGLAWERRQVPTSKGKSKPRYFPVSN